MPAPPRCPPRPERGAAQTPGTHSTGRLVREVVELAGAHVRDSLQPRPRTVRHGLVAWVRREMAAGTYVTDEKLDVALSRLIDLLARR